jgi:pyruvate kinase
MKLVLIEPVANTDAMLRATIESAQRAKVVHTAAQIVLSAGVPINHPGNTNLIKVHTVGQPLDPAPLESSV